MGMLDIHATLVVDQVDLWFWLIVGAIFLIKKVIEFLKPKEKDEETPVLDTEDHHEKRVKEVIAEMRRTNPQPRQPQPARPQAPARAPRRNFWGKACRS